MILAIPRCMSQHVVIITILHFNLLVVFVLQDASPHFKSNQEFFAFSRTQRQKALWNHQPSWLFSFIQKREALWSFSFLLYANWRSRNGVRDDMPNYIAPRSSLIVKFVISQTSLGPQYWIGPG